MNLAQELKQAKKLRNKWIDFSPYLTDKGKLGVKTGTVMGFKQEDGSLTHYKMVHINRKSNKFYMIELGHLYDKDELEEYNKQEEAKFKALKDKDNVSR